MPILSPEMGHIFDDLRHGSTRRVKIGREAGFQKFFNVFNTPAAQTVLMLGQIGHAPASPFGTGPTRKTPAFNDTPQQAARRMTFRTMTRPVGEIGALIPDGGLA